MKHTKWIGLIIGCALATSTWAQGSMRSVEQAKTEAQKFFQQPAIRRASAQSANASLELAYTYTSPMTKQPCSYVFNREGGGFVIVASTEQARTIWGYALEGRCDSTNIPPQLLKMLQIYSNEVLRVPQHTQAPQRQAVHQTKYSPIAPLLGKRIWGQGAPFNAFCPLDDGVRSVSGCVATAISQIMCLYQYPKRGTGSHSYLWNDEQLSADFAATTYDWTHMRANCNNVFTEEERQAIGQLVHHVGVASEMDYGATSSGANTAQAMQGLHSYFGYDANIYPLLKDYMSEAALLDSIYQELTAGRPLLVSASTANGSGHAFVCDGIDDEGKIHINWGWYGSMDGYYVVSAMAPEEQGTGGSASGSAFTEKVGFYTGIQPDHRGKGHPVITSEGLRLAPMNRLGRQDTTYLHYSEITNNGVWTFSGDYAVLIYSTSNQLLQMIPIYRDETLLPGYYYSGEIEFPLAAKDITVPNGTYLLTVGISNSTETKPFILPFGVDNMIPVTVTKDSIILEHEVASDEEQNLPYSFEKVNGYRYPSSGSNHTWKIQLETSGFWTSSSDPESNAILMLVVQSPEDKSFVGTYRYGGESSQEEYTINRITLFPGNEGNYSSVSGSAGIVTISYYPNVGYYEFDYLLKINGEWKSGYYFFNKDDVKGINSLDDTNIALKEQGGASSNVYQPELLNVKVVGDTAYFSWQVQQKADHFSVVVYADGQLKYANDLDTTAFQLYSPKKVTYKWSVYNRAADNTNKGEASQTITPTYYDPYNMRVLTINDTTYQFLWHVRDTTNAYLVEIRTADESPSQWVTDYSMLLNQVIYGDGDYQWTVTAYNYDGSNLSFMGETDGPVLTINTGSDRATVRDLQAQTDGMNIHYSWEGNAPYYLIQIYDEQENNVVNTYTTKQTYTYSALEYGMYQFYLRSCDALFSLAPYWYQVDATLSPSTSLPATRYPLPTTTKILRNGHLLILRDGKAFNAVGAEIK